MGNFQKKQRTTEKYWKSAQSKSIEVVARRLNNKLSKSQIQLQTVFRDYNQLVNTFTTVKIKLYLLKLHTVSKTPILSPTY